MNDPAQNEWHRLFNAALNGTISSEEKSQLATLLKTSADARKLWFLYHDNECSLAELKQARVVVSTPIKQRARFAWRPLTAAAAGLVIGLFSASMVFAYVAPTLGKVMLLLQQNFESGPPPKVTGVPLEVGVWSGDYSEVVSEQQNVKPQHGSKMLRLLRADYEGKENSEGSYVSDAWLLMDLRSYRHEFADDGAVVQVSAGFNAFAFPELEKYGVSVAMCALSAAQASSPSVLNNPQIANEALAMSRKGLKQPDRDPLTWQRLVGELRLPSDAEFLLIHFILNHDTQAQRRATFDGHFLDDVRVTLARRAPLP